VAGFDGAAGHQIHGAAGNLGQFLFHLDVVEQTPISLRVKFNDQINVALWPIVVE
jgi:hypothetical protein